MIQELEKKKMTNSGQIVVLRLGQEEYGIGIDQVKSIERIGKITRVPGVDSYVKGVMNLRGVITPVIDLRLRLGLTESPFTENNRIIIVSRDLLEVGLIVDETNDVLDISTGTIEPPPKGKEDDTHTDYLSGITKVESRLICLLELEEILHTKEVKEVI